MYKFDDELEHRLTNDPENLENQLNKLLEDIKTKTSESDKDQYIIDDYLLPNTSNNKSIILIEENNTMEELEGAEVLENTPVDKELDKAQYVAEIKNAWRKSIDAIIETGRLLKDAKENLNKKDKRTFKIMVEQDLPFSMKTVDRLINISDNKDKLNKDGIREFLPASWGSLALIAKMNEDEIIKAIDARIDVDGEKVGVIRPDMRRFDLENWKTSTKEKEKVSGELLNYIREKKLRNASNYVSIERQNITDELNRVIDIVNDTHNDQYNDVTNDNNEITKFAKDVKADAIKKAKETIDKLSKALDIVSKGIKDNESEDASDDTKNNNKLNINWIDDQKKIIKETISKHKTKNLGSILVPANISADKINEIEEKINDLLEGELKSATYDSNNQAAKLDKQKKKQEKSLQETLKGFTLEDIKPYLQDNEE